MRTGILLAAFVVFFHSCSNDDEPDVGTNSIAGTAWEGHFQGADQKSAVAVEVNFGLDERFDITNTSTPASKATGTFDDMPKNTRLTLNVEVSSFALIGETGSAQVFQYSHSGDELILEGPSGTYALKKTGTAVSGPLQGTWNCVETGNSWLIVISGTGFEAAKARPGFATLSLRGSVTYEGDAKNAKQAILTVQEASSPAAQGGRLQVHAFENEIQVTEIDSTGKPMGGKLPFACTRQ